MASPPDGYIGTKGFDTSLTKAIESVLVSVINGGAGVNSVSTIGGERNTSSGSNNYDAIKNECNVYQLANSGAAQNIGTSGTTPIFLMGISVRASTAGTITINSGAGFTDPTGANVAVTFPIQAVIVTDNKPHELLSPGLAMRCEAGCTITCSTAADGPNILVAWRPIN